MLKYLRMGSKRTKVIWWVLIAVTIGTFIGGFIWIFGAGLLEGGSGGGPLQNAAGTVNGEPIAHAELANAVAEQRAAFHQQYGADPADQDARLVEAQAWRSLVTQHMLDQMARTIGLKAHDREVVLMLETSPPNIVATIPAFQTDGKFDSKKYSAAVRSASPDVNWPALEQLVRSQLPVRKLQERLAASIKLAQPELKQAYASQFEKAAVTVVNIPAANDAKVTPPSDADIDRAYAEYKGRMSTPASTQIEVLALPRKYSPEELRTARELARTLVDRARRGEDFAGLARDYSEGAGAEKGGEINRLFQPAEFGPQLAPRMAASQKGEVLDPLEDSGRFMIFKVLDRISNPTATSPNLRVAQIIIKARPSEESQKEQHETLARIRDRAKQTGLGKAAAEKGLVTRKTGFFAMGNPPQELAGAPEAIDWAMGAKVGAVSPIFDGLDEYVLVQVATQRPAGPPAKEDKREELRQLAELEKRIDASRPKADLMARVLAQGKTLEEAAQAAGATPIKIAAMSRMQPDPRFGAVPEVVGTAFGAPVGKTVGPLRSAGGWFFVRVDQRTPADSTAFDQLKGQVASQVLQRKQQEFFAGWVSEQRSKARVQDLRSH